MLKNSYIVELKIHVSHNCALTEFPYTLRNVWNCIPAKWTCLHICTPPWPPESVSWKHIDMCRKGWLTQSTGDCAFKWDLPSFSEGGAVTWDMDQREVLVVLLVGENQEDKTTTRSGLYSATHADTSKYSSGRVQFHVWCGQDQG